jgi:hypothetical protein
VLTLQKFSVLYRIEAERANNMPFERILEAKIKLELKQHYSAKADTGVALELNIALRSDAAEIINTAVQEPTHTLNNEMEP